LVTEFEIQLADELSKGAKCNQALVQVLRTSIKSLSEIIKAKARIEDEAKAQKELISILAQEKEEAELQLSEANKTKREAEQQSKLLMFGEKQAMECNLLRIFRIYPKRSFEDGAASTHFRTAESQFHRLLGTYPVCLVSQRSLT